MRMSMRLLLCMPCVAIIGACAGDQLSALPEEPATPANTPATCQTGGLTGRLCLPGTGTALGGAHVYFDALDCNSASARHETTATDNGQFSLADLPVGSYTVSVES